MSDIVERLRDDERSEWGICNEAADEIERLRAEVAGLRAEVAGLRAEVAGLRAFVEHVRRNGSTHLANMAVAVLAARKDITPDSP